MQSHCYRRWRNLFHIVLGRFNLRHHVDVNNPLPNDPTWAQEDLTVLMWIHATLGDDLMDMVMEPNPTAFSAWDKIRNFFTHNKPSRAVHLEAEFHGLKQGDLSTSAYCHKLKTLADALADCDQPVGDRARAPAHPRPQPGEVRHHEDTPSRASSVPHLHASTQLPDHGRELLRRVQPTVVH